jgi:hypothetical protein
MSRARIAAVPFVVYPIGDRRCVVATERDGARAEFDLLAARILGVCRDYRHVDEHMRELVHRFSNVPPGVLLTTLQMLRDAGLLAPFLVQPHGPVSLSDRGESTIETIGVTTADRPRYLRRCLESIVLHCKRHNRRPALIVSDDSRSAEARAANRQLVADWAATGLSMTYLGDAERQELAAQLADRGVSRDAISASLTSSRSPSPGTSRNALILATVGEYVLNIDDDVVCETWPGEYDESVVLGGYRESRRTEFFDTRRAALPVVGQSGPNLLACNEHVLGIPLDQLVNMATPGRVVR